MMAYLRTLVQGIFPPVANNDYRGSPIAFYTMILLMLPMTFRSWVHWLWDDSGVNSIASIIVFPGDPDPNNIIYMFSSQFGAVPTVVLVLYIIVLLRYRSLIPLLYLLILLDVSFREVSVYLHPLDPVYYERRPPGTYGSLPSVIISLVMLHFSTRVKTGDSG